MTNSPATGIGTLYIVATPIGNRDDISLRALSTLKSVDLILAEDTRHSKPLLTSLGIKNNLSSLHAHNEGDKSRDIINQLLSGTSIALISDAGTPLISDPGYPLVKLAREHHITVTPIPGPNALITALCAAGVPCDVFSFMGFLPTKNQARINKLKELLDISHTLVFYESTHRILESLNDISSVYGESCEIVLVKELTKTFERFVSGRVTEVIQWLTQDLGHVKGEFVLIIPARPLQNDSLPAEQTLKILLEELPLKQAVSLACKLTQVNKNELYDIALRIKQS